MKVSELKSIKKSFPSSGYKIPIVDNHSTSKRWWLPTDLDCGSILTNLGLELIPHIFQILYSYNKEHVETWNHPGSFSKP